MSSENPHLREYLLAREEMGKIVNACETKAKKKRLQDERKAAISELKRALTTIDDDNEYKIYTADVSDDTKTIKVAAFMENKMVKKRRLNSTDIERAWASIDPELMNNDDSSSDAVTAKLIEMAQSNTAQPKSQHRLMIYDKLDEDHKTRSVVATGDLAQCIATAYNCVQSSKNFQNEITKKCKCFKNIMNKNKGIVQDEVDKNKGESILFEETEESVFVRNEYMYTPKKVDLKTRLLPLVEEALESKTTNFQKIDAEEVEKGEKKGKLIIKLA